jgi:hypothetical protein
LTVAIGVVLVLGGAVSANIANSVLKKKARREKNTSQGS